MLALSEPAAASPRPMPQTARTGQPQRSGSRGRHFGPSLSPREFEILLLLIEGMTDKQIGDALGISPRTVTTHVTSIYNKLGVFCRVAATTYAFRHGMV